MNRNVTALILIVLAIGVYFTFTQDQVGKIQLAQADNQQYIDAIASAKKLIAIREKVQGDDNKISLLDRQRLEKMIPSSTNNIHLIVDLNDLANTGHHFALTNIKAEVVGATNAQGVPAYTSSTQGGASQQLLATSTLSVVKVSFSAKTTYKQFLEFLQDLEKSLRITDISKLTVKGSDTGVYEFQVEIRTYWLKS